ncbi:uncharacterized protein TRUGW13939_05072 [Talaromyces rugulosus]|uniref:Fungal-type protein kinase domain-containing protein n=1 Tax=Talaromyces rugulosus TaxID=121627 RepID=A0A7H8QV61_TALRU|nr:uncharacterized protein TRUGW13939_05072 [Talaromyces rugulosus]QKX57952.1 hypothetical protein TRUGW13939_05072 [Talaromyces rugulosus]
MSTTVYTSESHLCHLRGLIKPGAYEVTVDHFWLNMLIHYFGPRYIFEREAYSRAGVHLRRMNVTMKNFRANGFRRVFVVEAKRLPKSKRYRWDKVFRQLAKYMREVQRDTGGLQTIYGIAAVGDRVRFYEMDCRGNRAGIAAAYPRSTTNPRTLGINTDAGVIHDYLLAIRHEISNGLNTH